MSDEKEDAAFEGSVTELKARWLVRAWSMEKIDENIVLRTKL